MGSIKLLIFTFLQFFAALLHLGILKESLKNLRPFQNLKCLLGSVNWQHLNRGWPYGLEVILEKIKIYQFLERIFLFILPLTVFAITLVGCANESAKEVNLSLRYITAYSVPVRTNNVQSTAQIAEASSAITRSLQQLSAIQMARNPGILLPRIINAAGLLRRGSLQWNGPVKQAVLIIAKAAHYYFRVLGSQPAIPVIVNISAYNQTLGTILRNIILQTESSVVIKIYPENRVIELAYRQK